MALLSMLSAASDRTLRLSATGAWHHLQVVEQADNPAATSRLTSAVEWAGYLALAPLVLCLAALVLLPGYAAHELAQRAAIAWGALLLVFGAALHLGGVLRRPAGAPAERTAWVLALLPLGCAAILLGGERALALLVVAHGGLWLYEHRVLGPTLPPFYLALRRQLAFAICTLLALTMFLSDSAGLG
jgi:hypothetical protein